MVLLFGVLLILLTGAVASLLLGQAKGTCVAANGQATPSTASRVAAFAGAIACTLGFGFAAMTLCQGVTLSAHIPLPLPIGRLLFQVDALASVFLLPVFLIGGIGSVLLPGRMAKIPTQQGIHGFFFCLLLAGMVLVLTAADGIFFLLAWEVMSLAPFFLLSARDKDAKERHSCWIYLVAAHLGALPLLLLFAMMTVQAGGSSFFQYASMNWQGAGLLFGLALVGFGAKFGLFPLHVWMPEGYPVAPGHVATVLSGAMVNVGLYGLLRLLGLLGVPQLWWAYALMVTGGISGFMGILFAATQPDIKRTLAYSSAENMGIICLSLGAGIFAGLNHAPQAMVLCIGGAILHMWNHSLFKGLLFVSAGAVEESTGTVLLNQLGGLQKRIPFTGACTAFGCAAIAGLPPLNGFMGEIMMYLGFAVGGNAVRGTEAALVFWVCLFALASIVGLALLCFTRMYGMAFLGTPRTQAVQSAQKVPADLRIAMGSLAALCALACTAAPALFRLLEPLLHSINHRLHLPALAEKHFAVAESSLRYSALGCFALLAVITVVAFVAHWLRIKNGSSTGMTWDCGYRLPSARMQYTGGSFMHSVALVAQYFLRARIQTPQLDKSDVIFPSNSYGTAPSAPSVLGKPSVPSAAFVKNSTPIPPPFAVLEAQDWPLRLYAKAFGQGVERLAERAKSLQHGLLNAYILYILLALLVALTWALGWS